MGVKPWPRVSRSREAWSFLDPNVARGSWHSGQALMFGGTCYALGTGLQGKHTAVAPARGGAQTQAGQLRGLGSDGQGSEQLILLHSPWQQLCEAARGHRQAHFTG